VIACCCVICPTCGAAHPSERATTRGVHASGGSFGGGGTTGTTGAAGGAQEDETVVQAPITGTGHASVEQVSGRVCVICPTRPVAHAIVWVSVCGEHDTAHAGPRATALPVARGR
jgi:hypothetical protein